MGNYDRGMDVPSFRIRRCQLDQLTTMAATTITGRRGPLRGDHSIKLTTQPTPQPTPSLIKIKLMKSLQQDTIRTPINYRRKRTPSPHSRRPITELTPKRPSLKRCSGRPAASPPLKRRSIQRLYEFSPEDCRGYPLFKDVNYIIRDDCQDSPLRSTDSSSPDRSTPPNFTLDSVNSTIESVIIDERMGDASADDNSSPQEVRSALYSPPRFLPYGSTDVYDLSPTRLPRHTSDTALINLHHARHQHFSSTSALSGKNDMPRCSSPEPLRPTAPTAPSTPRRQTEPQIRGRASKRPQRRSSLSEKLESLKTKAKSTIINLKRAVSTERIHRRSPSQTNSQSSNKTPNQSSEQSSTRSTSIKRSSSIKSRSGSKRRRSISPLRSLITSMSGSPGRWCSAGLDKSDMDKQAFTKRQFTTIGKLMAIHQDGTQTVLLERSSDSQLPFSLTKCPQKGVIISGLVSSYPDLYYAGLINVLDELLEINNEPCSGLCLDQVYKLLQAKSLSLVKIRPNLRRHGERQQ